jgi:hypothetical protein
LSMALLATATVVFLVQLVGWLGARR